MELCINQGVLNLQHRHRDSALLCPTPLRLKSSRSSSLLSSRRSSKSGLRYRTLTLRASFNEASREATEYVEETRDAVVALEDASSVEKVTKVEVVEPEGRKVENAPEEQQSAAFELLDKLDVKIDTDSTLPIILYGGGAIVSIWLAWAAVGAVDAIPVFPKLMELVGLAYTVWFTSRYLLFKESRDELATKIAELKLQILGSDQN